MQTAHIVATVVLATMAMSCDRCNDDGPVDDSIAHSETDSSGVDNDLDGYPVGQDCDDTLASVYPGAEEVCDGLDNDCNQQIDDVSPQVDHCDGFDDDCDGVVDEDEIAIFESDSGDVVDYSLALMSATASSPWLISIVDSGELRICGGARRYLLLDVAASLAIRPADPTMEVEISAGEAQATVIDVRGDSSVTVSMEDVIVRDGVGDCEVPRLNSTAGGGICCIGEARLVLDNVTLQENSAGGSNMRGGGLFVHGCQALIENSMVTGNDAGTGGGGMFVLGGEVLIYDSVFEANESSDSGSAIGLQFYNDGVADIAAEAVIDNTIVTDGFPGVAVWVGPYSGFECIGDSSGEYGIVQNEVNLGAVFLAYDSFGFTGTNCDMGSAADGNDNSGPDVYGDDDFPWTADIGNDATFFCSIEQDGCTIE